MPDTTHNRQPRVACRTCQLCRSRKVKCDGHQPECAGCRMRGRRCVYPEDGRRVTERMKMADIQSLQNQVEHLKGRIGDERSVDDNHEPDASSVPSLRTQGSSCSPDVAASRNGVQHCGINQPHSSVLTTTQTRKRSSQAIFGPLEVPEADDGATVYGATSLLHNQLGNGLGASLGLAGQETDTFIKTIARDKLVSQAALSAQREAVLYSTPSMVATLDFDGVPPDTAWHLLELHWNRLHFCYLLTYRPAIMDSLASGGPYLNKLLLNAIFLQSSLYSDLSILRSNPQDPQTTGMRFYDRFKELLPQFIDAPAMPTIVALLLCGACLVPYGKQSAGWLYCGMAYRMILDLGYHLDVPVSIAPGSQPEVSVAELEMRRRIYWGAYASDKFQSLYLGRSPALHSADANVPQQFLDSYEELSLWRPHSRSTGPSLDYQGRPCYAISTFQSLLELAAITEKISSSLYSLKSSQTPQSTLLQSRLDLGIRLDEWYSKLPDHLQFCPGKDIAAPPHQISLHTTYWTLVILTEQAFLRERHFNFTLDSAPKDEARKRAIDAALRIWRLLKAYHTTFTLRHAHYGIFYAAYSAVLALLQYSLPGQDNYTESIKFFWEVLSEYQRKYGRGLRKPFRILKSLMREIEELSQQVVANESRTAAPQSKAATTDEGGVRPDDVDTRNVDDWPDFWQELLDNETSLLDDTMYGLFMEP